MTKLLNPMCSYFWKKRKTGGQQRAKQLLKSSVIYDYCSSSVIRKRHCVSHSVQSATARTHTLRVCSAESEVMSGRSQRFDNNSDRTSVLFFKVPPKCAYSFSFSVFTVHDNNQHFTTTCRPLLSKTPNSLNYCINFSKMTLSFSSVFVENILIASSTIIMGHSSEILQLHLLIFSLYVLPDLAV